MKSPPLDETTFLKTISTFPAQERAALHAKWKAREHAVSVMSARDSFGGFTRHMWPGFIEGRHHQIMMEAFDRVLAGTCKRLIINMAPRHTKSEFASWLLPSKFMGMFPDRKIIQTSHTATLAEGFGRKVRNTVASKVYQEVFPGTKLMADSKAAGRWSTSANGSYLAIGVGGKLAGYGADLLIIDDPHALEVNTEVPTTQGFKTVGELEIGDCVFGLDGTPTKVVAKSGVWHDRELYAVTTSDDETIYCDGAHLWNYRSDTNKKKARSVNSTARELVNWSKSNLPCIYEHAPVQYPEQDLLIDPYILGAWLGDGTSSLGRMTAHSDDMPFMRGEFEAAGYKTSVLKDPWSFGVYGLRVQLRKIGVLDNKHIPEQYFIGSVAQRMALLQGLIDTDGSVDASSQCSFSNSNLLLATGVKELVHSLGVKAQMHVHIDKRERWGSTKPMYSVNFRLQDAARMPRKRERTRTPTDKRCRSITVEPTGTTGSVQCITVDRKDGLFLCGRGYVVTHNSEQDYMRALGGDPSAFDDVFEWYQTGPRQRLQPSASVVILATRWHKRDITGRLIQKMTSGSGTDQWEIIEFPAILNEKSLWPEFWPMAELEATRAELSVAQWNAQYLQNPTSEEGALIKRESWKMWEKDEPPECEYIIQCWDTAYLAKQANDDSACITWGIFYLEDPDTGINVANIILLDAYAEKLEFPALKKKAYDMWKDRQPDSFIIEAKASGWPLIFELRQMGVPVTDFTPVRGTKANPNDKIARVNGITDLFASGIVWCPDTRWADEVREQFAAFPFGDADDYVDAGTIGLTRFRQGGFIPMATDEDDEPVERRTYSPY